VYFENRLTLLESPQPDGKDIILQPGEFNYSFQFQLPPNLPPSARLIKADGTGSVEYFMKIEFFVKRKMKSADITAHLPFEVRVPRGGGKGKLYIYAIFPVPEIKWNIHIAISWLPDFFVFTG
jgi:hypothetical protein